ncbi:MAG: hypothetical protein VX834_03990 [Myxococcota bacterium]|nr:hypothetical protein [Myxococcota bacterium]
MTPLLAISVGAAPEQELLWTVVEGEEPAQRLDERAFVYDLELSSGFHATARAPETSLYFDDETGELLLRNLFTPRAPEYYPVLSAGVVIDTDWQDGWGLRLRADTGELYDGGQRLYGEGGLESNGQSLSSEFQSTGFIRELTIAWSRPWADVLIGKQQAMVLAGLVYGDDGLGISIHTDLEELGLGPFSAALCLQAVGYSWSDYVSPNPLLAGRLTWHHGFFENLALEGAVFIDRSDVFADALASLPMELALRNGAEPTLEFGSLLEAQSSGVMRYLGATGHHFLAERLSLTYAFAWQTGSLRTSRPDPMTLLDEELFADRPDIEADLAFDAWAVTAELHWSVSRAFGLSLFGVSMTGQAPPRPEPDGAVPMRVFVAPAPYWAWSGLFFSGMLNQGYLASRSNTAGINGHGVRVVGAKMDMAWLESQNLIRILWIRADEPRPLPGPGGPSVNQTSQEFTSDYGFEVDLLTDVALYEWEGAQVTLMTELDILFAGDFFREESVGYRFMGQLRVDYGG